LTQEEAEAFVWGPWEFNTWASEQVVSTRQTVAQTYSLVTGKSWDLLALNRTRPGHWMTGTTQDNWRKQYADQPLRLLIACRLEGHPIWIVPKEVMTESEGPDLY
jgi:hypothetical protein